MQIGDLKCAIQKSDMDMSIEYEYTVYTVLYCRSDNVITL